VLIFLALNAGAVLAALLLAYAAGAHERTGRLLFFTLCGCLIVIHSVALAAGVVGRLAPGGAVVGLALVLAIALSIAAWRRRRLAITLEPSVEGSLRFTSLTLVCPLEMRTPGRFRELAAPSPTRSSSRPSAATTPPSTVRD